MRLTLDKILPQEETQTLEQAKIVAHGEPGNVQVIRESHVGWLGFQSWLAFRNFCADDKLCMLPQELQDEVVCIWS